MLASLEDSLPFEILRRKSAVFYCKTMVSQSIMHFDTRSNSCGQTLNPYNLFLSAGGSSESEAAPIAYGSPLGFGTDIGGSVRQPCAVTSL